MRISDVRLIAGPDGAELAATLTFERPPARSTRLWFRTAPGAPPPVLSGDPFFAACVIPAMYLGEDLIVEAPVNPELVRGVTQRAAPIMLRWFPDFRAAGVETGGEFKPPAPPPSGDASTFSTGLDSWFTFLKHRHEVTHSLYIEGFDRPTLPPVYYQVIRDKVARQAERFGLQTLFVTSNLNETCVQQVQVRQLESRRPVRPFFSQECSFIGSLSAGALCFQDRISKLYVAGTNPYESIMHAASNPLIDPCWSTGALNIVHDGAEADRTRKAAFIWETDPEAMAALSVCGRAKCEGPNCGRCEKCLRTMVSCRLAGVTPDRWPFERALDLDAIAAVEPRGVWTVFWEELLEHAREGGDNELTAAIETALGTRFRALRMRNSARALARDCRNSELRRKRFKNWKSAWRERRARWLKSL